MFLSKVHVKFFKIFHFQVEYDTAVGINNCFDRLLQDELMYKIMPEKIRCLKHVLTH